MNNSISDGFNDLLFKDKVRLISKPFQNSGDFRVWYNTRYPVV